MIALSYDSVCCICMHYIVILWLRVLHLYALYCCRFFHVVSHHPQWSDKLRELCNTSEYKRTQADEINANENKRYGNRVLWCTPLSNVRNRNYWELLLHKACVWDFLENASKSQAFLSYITIFNLSLMWLSYCPSLI